MLINVPKDLGKPTPVPAAIYKVLVTGYKLRESKAGNQLINIELTIQSQGPDESVKTIGRKLFDTWTCSEKALGVWNQKYKALCGQDLPAGEFSLDEFINRVTSDVMNKEGLAQVEIKPDLNGDASNNIKSITRIA